MAVDRPEQIVGMRRRDLASLHASELSRALFPAPERDDDALTDEEKSQIQTAVSALVNQHRHEIAQWEQANG